LSPVSIIIIIIIIIVIIIVTVLRTSQAASSPQKQSVKQKCCNSNYTDGPESDKKTKINTINTLAILTTIIQVNLS